MMCKCTCLLAATVGHMLFGSLRFEACAHRVDLHATQTEFLTLVCGVSTQVLSLTEGSHGNIGNQFPHPLLI